MNESMAKYALEKFAGYEYLWMGLVGIHNGSISDKYLLSVHEIINGSPTIFGMVATYNDAFLGVGFYSNIGEPEPIDIVEFESFEIFMGRTYDIKFPGYANLIEAVS